MHLYVREVFNRISQSSSLRFHRPSTRIASSHLHILTPASNESLKTSPLHPLNQTSYSPPSAPRPLSSPSSHPSPHPYSSSLLSITPNALLSHPEFVPSSLLGPRSVSVAPLLVFAPSPKLYQNGNFMWKRAKDNTLTIPLFRTKTCFRGAIVLAPFFGPNTACLRLEFFAVAEESLEDLMVPCAMSASLSG
jgi:hypothetical protein